MSDSSENDVLDLTTSDIELALTLIVEELIDILDNDDHQLLLADLLTFASLASKDQMQTLIGLVHEAIGNEATDSPDTTESDDADA